MAFNSIKNSFKSFFNNSKNEAGPNRIDNFVAQANLQKLSEKFTREQTGVAVKTFKHWREAVEMANDPENPDRSALEELYKSLLIDRHLYSVIDSRVLKVMHSKFVVSNENGDENYDLRKLFEKSWFQDFVKIVLWSKFKGTTLIELYDTDELGHLTSITTIPQSNVIPTKGLVIKEAGDTTGWQYKEAPLNRYYVQAGKDDELGQLRDNGPMILGKKMAIGSWLDFIAKFGVPPRWVTTDREDQARLDQLFGMMKSMISNHFAVLRGSEKIEIAKTPSTDAYQVFDKLISRVNSEISKAVLGQDGTSDHNKSSGTYGSLKVLKEIADDRHKSDKVFVRNLINDELIPRLLLISSTYSGLANHTFDWDLSQDMSKSELIESVTKLAPYYDIDLEYLTEKTGIPLSAKAKVPGGIEPVKKKSNLKVAAEIDTLYTIGTHTCDLEHHDEPIQAILPANWTKLIDQIAKDIHSGKLKPGDLNRSLIEKTYHQLDSAASSGYGSEWIKYDPTKKNGSIKALKKSLWRFSGAKTFQELSQMRDMLVKNGKVLSFPKFKNEVLKVHKSYNINYLQAEYQTAKQSAAAARKWQSIQKNKDLYLFPNLEYRTVGDNRVRDAHALLHGIIKPVDDPFWNTHYPPNDWRCRCYVKQTSSNAAVTKDIPSGQVRPAFQNNSGKSNKIFSDKHPYFKIPKSEAEQMRIEFEKTKEFAPYHTHYKKDGYKLLISEFADPIDLQDNIKTGKIIVDKLKADVSIRPDIRLHKHKNPEYFIRNMIADRKGYYGRGLTSSLSEAKEQNCELIVFDLLKAKTKDDVLEFLNKLKGAMMVRTETHFKEFIFVDAQRNAYLINLNDLLNGKYPLLK